MKRQRSARPLWQSLSSGVLFLSLAFALAPALGAQTSPLVQRLSPDTIFYVEWRGAASLGPAAQKNHLIQLLRDPDTAAMMVALGGQIQRSSQGPNPTAALLLPDLASFLDNGVVLGAVTNPEARKVTSGKHASPVAFFLVYDATGKTDLIRKWRTLSRVGSQTPVEITNYDFGGTSVEVRRTNTGSSYSAQAGKYFVGSDQKKIIEDLITRFSSSGLPASSVEQLAEYAQVRKYVGEDAALEFFGRIPDVTQWNMPSNANEKSGQQLVKNLHLDKVQVMGGGLTLDGEAARMRGAILGDASPVSPFDVAGASGATFRTLPAIQNAPAFSISRIDLPATYHLIMTAVQGNLTAQQAGNVQMAEAAAQSFLGMPIIDALKLFTGEIGSMETYSEDGKMEQLFAVSIQKPDAVLRVTRALIGSMIVSEDSSGATTYLDLAYPYMDPETHQRRRRFYYVAVTPQLLLVAPRKGMLHQAIERIDAGTADPPPAGVVANSDYAQLRSRLPEKLSGLGAADLARIPWDKLIANLATQSAENARGTNRQALDLSSVKASVISRYLHIATSGWWKDSNGLYFDSYIQ